MNNVSLKDKILPAFYDFWDVSRASRFLYYVLKGGRGGSKSTHIGIDIVMDIMQLPITVLCVRRHDNTLEKSVFQQIKWAINHLGVSRFFKFNTHPLKITYKPRGNTIIFRGANDPESIKSIKEADFPIARLWVEEITNFKTYDELSTIVLSVVRDECPVVEITDQNAPDGKRKVKIEYKVYFSYNPPKRRGHWANKKYESVILPRNTFVHHSTYLDNPFLSKAFIAEAQEVKRLNYKQYEWEYLGKPIGAGIVPFDNLTFRKITDEEYARFDNIKQGNDWGYGTDPLAFVRLHYDKTRRILYAMDELYGVKIKNRELSAWIKRKQYDRDRTIADSAEPKSIDEVAEFDIHIVGALKGPGSVEHGEKWLDELTEIVIDPARTPNMAQEFESIDYKTDKDGNIKNKLDESNNHTIDATRYAMEDEIRGSGTWKAAKSL